MTAIRSQWSRVFAQLLVTHRQALLEALGDGVPIDYAAYRQIVGRIEGIDDALKFAEEADFKLSGEEPDAGN
jgi:hypothetical protein